MTPEQQRAVYLPKLFTAEQMEGLASYLDHGCEDLWEDKKDNKRGDKPFFIFSKWCAVGHFCYSINKVYDAGLVWQEAEDRIVNIQQRLLPFAQTLSEKLR